MWLIRLSGLQVLLKLASLLSFFPLCPSKMAGEGANKQAWVQVTILLFPQCVTLDRSYLTPLES